MWVKANFSFDRFRAGKVYDVPDDLRHHRLIEAGYLKVHVGRIEHADMGYVTVAPGWTDSLLGVAYGSGEPGPAEENFGGTEGGAAFGAEN